MIRTRPVVLMTMLLALAACGTGDTPGGGTVTIAEAPSGTTASTPAPASTFATLSATAAAADPAAPTAITVTPVARFAYPWAMAFLPDGRLLVTEKEGRLRIVRPDGIVTRPITGVPAVSYALQGGLLDVIVHPQFAANRRIFLSYAEAGRDGTKGLAVARAELDVRNQTLANVRVIWRQQPKVTGDGHFGGRLAIDASGFLFITAGERQKGEPAQDRAQTLGKVVRIRENGGIPADNPFAGDPAARPDIWSYGHRNPYGLAFDSAGRLWEHEHGPDGGDELNVIVPGGNYGWPLVSNGDNYNGKDIPDHRPGDGFVAPATFWNPVIAPAGLVIYSGDLFPAWRGDALIGGLRSRALIRVDLQGEQASEVERMPMRGRIREVEQGSDGALWLLEDGPNGRLLKVTPAA